MIFSETYYPRTADFARDGLLSYEAILQIIETAGSHHSDTVNDNIIQASRNGIAWILADWRVEIIRRTESTEKLQVSTWVRSKSRAAIIYRNFTLTDADGKDVVRAEAKLCVVDVSTGKLTRISDELLSAYAPEERSVFQTDAPKLRAPESFDTECPLSIRRSDIDFNGHVHNTRYMDYALEALPRDVYDSCDFKEIRIAYTKPVLETDRITAKCSVTENGAFVGICSDGALCTLVQMK